MPHGHYETTAVTAALRTTGLVAPALFDGATDSGRFRGGGQWGHSRGHRCVFSKRIAAICSEMRAKRKVNTPVINSYSRPDTSTSR